jgi:hypothetical protein
MGGSKKSDFEKTDFRYYYGCDYDYEMRHPCYYDDRCKNDYCRCGVIEDARVTTTPDALTYIKNQYGDIHELATYCAERILNHFKFYDPDSFEVKVCGGYYGEEIDGVYFNDEQAVDAVISQMLERSDYQKVEMILDLEYGYVLEAAQDCRWSVATVIFDDLTLGQQDHYRKAQHLTRYDDYKLPRAVVLGDGPRYRVIDGYHRLRKAKELPNFKVIVGEKL